MFDQMSKKYVTVFKNAAFRYLFIAIVVSSLDVGVALPEQIHLSYGVDPGTMVVTWTTMNSSKPALVQYGERGLFNHKVAAIETKFVDNGSMHRTEYIYKAWMTDLTPGHKYVYRVGNDQLWSESYHFMAQPNSSTWQPRFVFIGDLGYSNAQSLPRLQRDADAGIYDVMIHLGDIAYDLDSNNATVGDKFMNLMQPIVANLPYLTCPGNHEYKYNFSNYKHRFTMPHDEFGESLYYSIDIGPVHLISINTEYMIFLEYGFWQILYQYHWLEQDLKRASTKEARAKQPWIITIGHRPFYCSNSNTNLCTYHLNFIRAGLPYFHFLSLENLFHKYGVDLSFWAHEHSYERLFPMYNYKVMNGSYSEPYTNPKATVHIVSGSAGNSERHDHFKDAKPSWSAFRSDDYSYMRMKVFNSTHLYMEVVSDDKGGKVIDTMTLIQNRHGPFEAT